MELKEYLNADGIDYHPFLSKEYILDYLRRSDQYWIKAYLKALRKEEYYTFYRPNMLLRYYHLGRKHILGRKSGFSINAGNFGPGLKINQYGLVKVHPKVRVGCNCILHGDCYIGSKGPYPDDSPIVGDNVEIGHSVSLVGNIKIADGVRINAESIVILSILEPNVTVEGVPAKIVAAS